MVCNLYFKSQLFKVVQEKENHSINLLSDAVVRGPEGPVSHLMDIHFPGSIDMVLGGGEEDICFGSFAGAHWMIDYIALASIQEAICSFGKAQMA